LPASRRAQEGRGAGRLGLGYLTLGQSATTVRREAQRIKIASELSTLQRSGTRLILDEPTTGHLRTSSGCRLLNRLVDAGHTVALIEHHMDVIKTADHVIDPPDGGTRRQGGGERRTRCGRCKASHTGRFRRRISLTDTVAGASSAQTDQL
jgi:excinuclease ABC subunit A